MGEVYRAVDARLGREVAIKVLPEGVWRDPERLQRFEREARAAGGLNHPNVLAIHDIGESPEGFPYLVCELLEGETLRSRLGRGGVPIREALDWAEQVAHGLSAAHERGVVHRDLKPENLFLTRDGRVKILDFGLAKLLWHGAPTPPTEPTETDSGTVAGTASYMSPEQVRHLSADPRSDIFSFGVVLFELLSGVRPFAGGSAAEAMASILRDDPAPLRERSGAVPAGLERLLSRCLAKRPEDRFQSTRDLALALEAVSAGIPRPLPGRVPGEPSPYPGLASFSEAEAEVFFGREAEREQVRRLLSSRHLVGLIGPSGAGKTSFLRAGLLPALPEGWRRLYFTPGRDPLASLCRALVPVLSGDTDAIQRLVALENPDALIPTIVSWRQGAAEAVLVADQFEELFTLCTPSDRDRFAALLGRLIRNADVRLLVSLRDDFLFRCHEHEALASLFTALYPLGPLSGAGLRRALVQPALRHGYRFEDEALVEAMLDAVREERAALPLLAFTAERLWLARDTERRLLTRRAYEETGGVGAALAKHAEVTLRNLGPDREGLARELLRNLVTSQGTRLVRPLDELLSAFEDRDAAAEVVRALVGARLLTSWERDTPSGEATTEIELVHESLVTAWPRLVRWRAQDAEGALLRDQLRQAARLWDERGRAAELLWTGRAFREFQLWRERQPGALVEREKDFARAMIAHARRRSRRRRASLAAALLALAAALAAMTVLYRRAEEEVRTARAARLVALGRDQLERDPSGALAFALASLETADTVAGRRFAQEILWRGPQPRILPIDASTDWWRVALSPDGEWLAASSFGDTVRVWSRDGPEVARLAVERSSSPREVAFLQDSHGLLTASLGTALRLFSVPGGTLVRTLDPPQGLSWFTWGARTPEGGVLVVLEPRGEAHTWDVRSGALRFLRSVPPGARSGAIVEDRWLTLREDGDLVASSLRRPSEQGRVVGRHPGATWVGAARTAETVLSSDDEGGIRVWRLGERLEPWRTLRTGKPRTGTLSASGPRLDPHGEWVVAPQLAEGQALLWSLRDPAGTRPLRLRIGETTRALAFDGRGDWMAVAGGGAVELWPLRGPRTRVLEGHSAGVVQARFAPDGETLYSASLDGTVREWPLADSPRAPGVALSVSTPAMCYAAAVSPDGRWLVGAFTTGERLLLADRTRPQDPPVRLDWPFGAMAISGLAFSPDGQRLVVASSFSTGESGPLMRVWDLRSRAYRDYPLLGRELPPSAVLEHMSGYAGGVLDASFAPDGRLFTAGSGGVREWNLDDGTAQWLRRAPTARLAPTVPDGRLALILAETAQAPGRIEILELGTGRSWPLPAHGDRVLGVTLDPTGRVAVSGSADGVVRVGRIDGSEPHLLYGHEGPVADVGVSPDGAWVVSTGSDATVRLWPMPDLDGVPLHQLPRDALLTKLRALTNRRAVESEEAPTGYRLALDPFRGWRDEPW